MGRLTDLVTEVTLQGFTREFLCSLFDYDPETGIVTRKVRRQTQVAGTVVGTVDGKGYLHVSIEKRFVRLHRLVWFMQTGVVPPEKIDHRNNVRTDNRWDNLRLASQQQNVGNMAPPSHNTSGYKGVSLNSKSRLWHVQIKKFGKQTYIARHADKHAAALIYNHEAALHFGEFAQLNDVPGFGRVGIPASCIDLFL